MSKRKLAYQFAGGVVGLIGLNLVGAPSAEANMPFSNPGGGVCSSGCVPFSNPGGGGKEPPFSNPGGYGNNPPFSNPGGVCTTGGCPPFSNPGGYGNKPPFSNPGGGECKTGKCDGTIPEDGRFYTDRDAQERAGYVIGLGTSKAPGYNVGAGTGVSNYGASSAGLSRQMMELLNAASNAYAEASARLAAIQSQATPSAQKDTSVRYSRVADANADCGCNASAAAPDNSVELAAAKKAEAEAAASLAKAQQQAREFLEAQKKAGNNLANGTQFTPIW
jgi:hypothetical protein